MVGETHRRRTIFTVVAALLLSVTAAALFIGLRPTLSGPQNANTATSCDSGPVLLTVLKDYVNHLAKAQGNKLFFVRLPDGTDPTFSLLEQLRTSAIVARGASNCETTQDVARQVVDKQSREPGVLVEITSCEISGQKAVVQVRYDMFSLGAGSRTYRLECRGNDWVVTATEDGPMI